MGLATLLRGTMTHFDAPTEYTLSVVVHFPLTNMKTIFITFFVFLIHLELTGQHLTEQWIDSLSSYEGFQEINSSKFHDYDFSQIISNQKMENDPLSTYVGVFGSKHRRIDFHLTVTKENFIYHAKGKSKLNHNVRELNGEFKLLKTLYRKQDYIADSLFIAIFTGELNEPGDKDGDGVFQGVFTLVFYIEDDQIKLFKTSSGDTPSFTNTFVGHWKKFGSGKQLPVIFSFHAAGLYEKLPYCNSMYTIKDYNDDYTIIREEYYKYGCEDYEYNGNKSPWWK